MAAAMMANGKTIKCMAMEPSLGKMEDNIKADTKMIKKKEMESINGKTVEFMMVNG